MPTGYTAAIVDGKMTELKDFVILCCRAFGACVEMRDQSMDATIPDEFKPSDYYQRELDQTRVDLEKLKAMTPDEALAYGECKKQSALASSKGAQLHAQQEDARLNDMIAKVVTWDPPTSDHAGLKDFMLQQLRDSRSGGDYWSDSINKTEAKPAIQFYHEALMSAERNVVHYADEQEKENARCQGRSHWMKAVRESLK